jgi:FkbH-like protein
MLFEDINAVLTYPFDNDSLLKKQKKIKRKLLERETSYLPKRIAILCGSTTADIRNLLEIFLLNVGIRPVFYESGYNRYYEDAVFDNAELDAFNPEIIIIFTSIVNITHRPVLEDTEEEVAEKLQREFFRFKEIWESLNNRYSAIIIQNNIELPYTEPEGNYDAVFPQGMERFINALNEKFSAYAQNHMGFYIHDLNWLSAEIGLSRWHNRSQYYAYKFAMNYDVMPDVAWSLKRLICAVLGRAKKCLVLDLDNTLWGGVIGDDGVNGIVIGHETPLGEAYIEFQCYVKTLKERGVILAVCSKNDMETARSGFSHPDSVLSVDDFAAFHASWEPKNIGIRQIAQELNIGLDSLVFIDDNPAERAIVRENIPEVSVPEVDPDDVFSYIRVIEKNGYFDTIAISEDDRKRSQTYQQNRQRAELKASAGNYDDFLASLAMEAEVAPFSEVYFDRIVQLTNKSNQFNLTTKRYTLADIRTIAASNDYITLYCRLKDRFGDNGLISLIIAEKRGEEFHIILWLMSCRVLKRGVEALMLDHLVREAKTADCKKLVGYYYKTKKNGIVAEHYKDFGFQLTQQDGEDTVWELPLAGYMPRNRFIREL